MGGKFDGAAVVGRPLAMTEEEVEGHGRRSASEVATWRNDEMLVAEESWWRRIGGLVLLAHSEREQGLLTRERTWLVLLAHGVAGLGWHRYWR